MEIKRNLLWMIYFIGIFCSIGLHTKVRPVMSRRELEQAIAKKSIIVVLFYEEQKNNTMKDLVSMYEDVSSYRPYNEADIVFLKVNTKRKELENLAQLYRISKIPSFIFFNQGMPLLNSQKMPIVIEGNIARSALQNFINKNFGSYMQNRIEKKAAHRKAVAIDEGESWKPYFYERDMFVRGYSPEERDME